MSLTLVTDASTAHCQDKSVEGTVPGMDEQLAKPQPMHDVSVQDTGKPAKPGKKRSAEAVAALGRLNEARERGDVAEHDIQAEYVALRLRTHVVAVENGVRCQQCWLHPQTCICRKVCEGCTCLA